MLGDVSDKRCKIIYCASAFAKPFLSHFFKNSGVHTICASKQLQICPYEIEDLSSRRLVEMPYPHRVSTVLITVEGWPGSRTSAKTIKTHCNYRNGCRVSSGDAGRISVNVSPSGATNGGSQKVRISVAAHFFGTSRNTEVHFDIELCSDDGTGSCVPTVSGAVTHGRFLLAPEDKW